MRILDKTEMSGIDSSCSSDTNRNHEKRGRANNPFLRIIALAFSIFAGAVASASAQPICPIADPLCQTLAPTQCLMTVPGTICRAQTLILDPGAPGGIRAETCSCYTDTECGGIQYAAAANAVRCVGACPIPPNGNECQVFVDGAPSGTNFLVITGFPPFTHFSCGCVPPQPPPCAPNAAGTACNQTVCPNGVDACLPKCIRVTPTGQQIVESCDCVPTSQCHAQFGSPAPNPPSCVGGCPPGFTCNQTTTTNADGSITYCCSCVPIQQTCPVADPLCNNLVSGCVSPAPGSSCRAQMIIINTAGIPVAENCACMSDTDCGAIIYTASTNTVRCLGTCPVPPPGNQCVVFVNGVSSGQNTVFVGGFPPGTTFTCGCAPPPPPNCAPNTTGTACNPTTCPIPGEVCLPVCIRVGPNGQQTVVECDCMADTECHIIPAPVGSNQPTCVGVCPPGFSCERTAKYNPADGSTTYCCRCRPDPIHCEPLPDQSACPQTVCPVAGDTCRPKCIEIDNQGLIKVVNCECGNPNGCHAEMGPAGPICVGGCPPGFTCVQQVIQTPTGTTYCCECVPDPQTCPIGDPICNNMTSGCLNPTPGSTCRAQMLIITTAGTVIAENCACFNDTDCGAIAYFPTANVVRCVGNCPIPPAGNECEVFINGQPSGQNTVSVALYPPGTTFTCGCAPPPPLPCTPNATGSACNPTVCPTPGETCLPVCIRVGPNGQQTVVECECMPDTRCHIIPAPAGATQPICIGTCPPGFTCDRSVTFNPADGSTTYCCRCRPDPIHCEPLPGGTGCPQTLCPNTSDTCRPKCIEIDHQGLIKVVNCECGNPNGCHAEMGPAGPICVGGCPPGMTCVQQVITTPTGTTYCCECVQTPPTCPVGDPLCNNMTSGCLNPTPGSTCRAQMIIINTAGVPIAENCACFSDTDCGAISYLPALDAVRCVGTCPVPPTSNQCIVFINGVSSGQSIVNAVSTYPPGTTFRCGCAPPPPNCSPNATGNGCNPTPCPTPGEVCRPRCIRVSANNVQTVVDCECMPDTQCHIIPGPAGTNQPICVGVCPPGFVCERAASFDPTDGSTTYCCSCRPDVVHCEPLPDGSACQPSNCPFINETCKPKCIEVTNDGQFKVINCDCSGQQECHAELGPAGPICVGVCPPGYQCVQHVYPTKTGIAYCCECVPVPEFCEPTANGQDCTQFNCPPGQAGLPHICKPRCVRYNPATGQYVIRDCDCRADAACFVDLGGPAPNVPHCAGNCPPGTYCVENRIVHPDGTVEICCDCKPVTCDCPGDVNGDGVLNGLDIAGFVRCWVGNSLPGDNCACADINGDGVYTPADMQAFIQRLFSKAPCTPCCPLTDLNVNLATGVNANGGLIPVNGNDDDWNVLLEPPPVGTLPRPANIVAPHPSWVTFPNSQWVSANYFGPNGDYLYRLCFCLDDRATNVVITLRARADDDGQIFLNGNFVANTAAFSDPNPPVINVNPAFLVAGENCITVRVQNIGGAPTGLNMIGSITARGGKCCCPPANLTKNVDSGVYDINGPLIPFGQDDDTWTVTCDATGGTVPRPAQTIVPHPAWATIPGTRWISATTGATNGWYCYKYCFCLDPRFKNAALTMSLLADDYAEVYLNGVQVGKTPNGWAFLGPPTQLFVTNQALFKPCENCIEIRVLNAGGVITGMDVKGTITAEDGLCCDDRSLSCCTPQAGCIDLAPGNAQCDNTTDPPSQLVPGPCGPAVACCRPNGTCTMLSERCCLVAGGTPSAPGVSCSTTGPQACCLSTPGCSPCVVVDPACCVSIYNGTPQGPGSFCPPPPP